MLAEGWADADGLDQRARGIRQEVDDAVAWAESSPFPDPATLLDGVYESR